MTRDRHWKLKCMLAAALVMGAPAIALHHDDSIPTTEVGNRKYLKDYREFPFAVPITSLEFDIQREITTVTSRLLIVPKGTGEPLALDGENQTLVSVSINDKPVADYQLTADGMVLSNVPDEAFWLEIVSTNVPSENHRCSGLYTSDESWVTQCESLGFRRITYFPDRPDVVSRYTVSVTADKASCPVLLSNGNEISRIDLGDRHRAVFHDPFMKPSYLFALVAGDFGIARESYTTRSGRPVSIECYVPRGLETRVGMRNILIANMTAIPSASSASTASTRVPWRTSLYSFSTRNT